MARAHEIAIAADAKAFDQGIRSGVIKPLELAEKALDDLGDAADDAGRDGSRGIDRLEDALKDAQQQAKKTERSVDDIGGVGKASFGKMSEGAKEVSQEIGQNLGEAVSSVRGDLSDLGQVGQDTLGGLAATLAGGGPAGIAGAAALAAGAVGLGLITAEIEKQNAEVQQLKTYFADAWKTAMEGGRDYIDAATVIGEMNSIMFDPDRAEEYRRIQEDVKTLGIDQATLLRAAAGDQDALNLVIERTSSLYDDAAEAAKKSHDERKEAMTDEEIRASAIEAQIAKVNERWQRYGTINDENKKKAQDSAAYTDTYLRGLIGAADDAAVSVDSLNNKMIELPTGETIYINAETGQATLDLETFQGDADGVIDHVNGKTVAIKATTSVDTSEYDRVVRRISNTTLKIGTKVITSGYDQ